MNHEEARIGHLVLDLRHAVMKAERQLSRVATSVEGGPIRSKATSRDCDTCGLVFVVKRPGVVTCRDCRVNA